MKTLVILGAVFVFVQATSPPVSLQQQSKLAVGQCVQEKSLDLKHIGGILQNNVLPEDNAEFTDFFECFYRKLGIIKEDGIFDHLVVKILSPQLIKDKYPNIVDVDKVADAAYEHCKDTPLASEAGLTGIKSRNCLLQYAAQQAH